MLLGIATVWTCAMTICFGNQVTDVCQGNGKTIAIVYILLSAIVMKFIVVKLIPNKRDLAIANMLHMKKIAIQQQNFSATCQSLAYQKVS